MLPAPPSEPGPGPVWPATPWHLTLLGGFTLWDASGHCRRLPGLATQRLLARLALWPQRAHAREELIELLWPGVDLATGRNRLRQTLSVLRQVLHQALPPGGSVLTADRLHVRLDEAGLACDARLFQAACGRDPVLARRLYQGELMPGFYDDWVEDERLRLAGLADQLDGAGMAPMSAMPATAPQPPRHKPPRRPRAPAPAPAACLPQALTPAFGMAEPLAQLAALLAGRRLVTVLGPGGVGKTRLALEGARRWSAAHPDARVAWVSLVHCRSGPELLARMRLALQLDPTAGDDAAALTLALAGPPTLLLLDNLEQAAAAAGALVAPLLAALPELRLLVTSRVALDLDGEQLLPLAPLPLPQAPHRLDTLATQPAVALYLDRAQQRRPDFHLHARNAEDVARLVGLLEGLPLAIELAAARVRSLPPASWVALLEAARDGRPPADPAPLDLLSRQGAAARVDVRHASMRAVVAASWELLTDAQAELLSAMTVFDGGCDVPALLAVTGPATAPLLHATLDTLLNASMVRPAAEATAPEAQPRFDLPEPVREYATERIAPEQAAHLRARHRRWLVDWGRQAHPTPDLRRLQREWPNLLRGLATALADGHPAQAWAIAWAHRDAWVDCLLPPQGLKLLQQALAALPPQAAGPTTAGPGLQLLAHALLASLCFDAGQPEQARTHLAAVFAALGSPEGASQPMDRPEDWPTLGPAPPGTWALGACLRVALRLGQISDPDDRWLTHPLAVARACGDAALQARIENLRSVLMLRRGHPLAEVEALRRQILGTWERSGNRLRVNEGRVALAIVLGLQHRQTAQLSLLAKAEAEALALDQRRLLYFIRSVTGYALADLGRHPAACEAFLACIRDAAAQLAGRELFYGLWNLPRSLAHLRQPALAARVMGFAQAFYLAHYGPLGPEDTREARRTRRLVQVQIGQAATDVHWAEGAEDTLDLLLTQLPLGLPAP